MPDPNHPSPRSNIALLVGIAIAVPTVVGLVLGLIVGLWWVGLLLGVLVGVAAVAYADRRGLHLVLSVSRAEPALESEFPRLHNVVEGLCIAHGLPRPELFVVRDDAANSFVAGRDPRHGAIGVTTGLLERLDRVELEGVLAHQLAELRSPALRVELLAVTIPGAVPLLADLAMRHRWWNGGRVPREGDPPESSSWIASVGGALLAVTPAFAPMLRLVVGPAREQEADVAACRITRYPPGLAAALEEIRSTGAVTHAATMATAHLWLEQPMAGVGDDGQLGPYHRRFDTHPPLDERIALLREL